MHARAASRLTTDALVSSRSACFPTHRAEAWGESARRRAVATAAALSAELRVPNSSRLPLHLGPGVRSAVEQGKAGGVADAPVVEVPASAVHLCRRDPRWLVDQRSEHAGLVPASIPQRGGQDSVIRQRPDVAAAERQIAVERALVGAAKAEYLPRLSLGGSAGYSAAEFDALVIEAPSATRWDRSSRGPH